MKWWLGRVEPMTSLLLLPHFLLLLLELDHWTMKKIPASLSSLLSNVDCTNGRRKLLATGTCNAQNCRGDAEMRQRFLAREFMKIWFN